MSHRTASPLSIADELEALAAAIRAGAKGAKGERAYARWLNATDELREIVGAAGAPRELDAYHLAAELDPIFGERYRKELDAKSAKAVKS